MELIKPLGFRKIIDSDGIFQMMIPPTWRYYVMEDKLKLHSFEDNEISSDADCFQLTVIPITEEEKNNIVDGLGYLPRTMVGDFDCRSHKDTRHKGQVTKTWSTVYDHYHIFFTFTYRPHYKKEYRKIELENKLKLIYTVFSSFDLLPEDGRDQIVTSHRFEVFLQGMGATNLLVQKAIENKAFFEATCLFGNQIDSLLRIAIILKHQLIDKNDIIGLEWIYQGPKDKKKSEKDIYKKALALNVIDQDTYDYLFELYEDRNRVIHRFIISEITLAEVEQIAIDYYFLRKEMAVIVDELETEQVNLNIGMTTTDIDDPGNRSHNLVDLLGKIGTFSYFEGKEDDV